MVSIRPGQDVSRLKVRRPVSLPSPPGEIVPQGGRLQETSQRRTSLGQLKRKGNVSGPGLTIIVS